jgi:hypothetical protein
LFHDFSGHRSVIRAKSAHKKIVAEVLASLPPQIAEQHADWIQAALRDANRKRLVDQLRDLFDAQPAGVLEACEIANVDEFAAIARSSRNYFTHPTDKKPANVPDGRDLLVLRNRLWFLLRACVLGYLGFNEVSVVAALRRSAQRHYFFS